MLLPGAERICQAPADLCKLGVHYLRDTLRVTGPVSGNGHLHGAAVSANAAQMERLLCPTHVEAK